MAFSTKMLYTLENNADANLFSESELMSKILFLCQPDHLMCCQVNYFKKLIFFSLKDLFFKITMRVSIS